MEDINSESQLNPAQLPVAIEDTEIDPEQIMSVIRERLAYVRGDKANDGQSFPAYGASTYPDKPDDIPYDVQLYHHLDLVNREQSQNGTNFDFKESAFSRIPIIGKLWRRLQIKLHGPALHYANRVAERQAVINGEMVAVLNMLLSANQGQQREINALKVELKRFREQDQ